MLSFTNMPYFDYACLAYVDSTILCALFQSCIFRSRLENYSAAELNLPTEQKKKIEGQPGLGAPEDLPVEVKPAVKHVISKELQVSLVSDNSCLSDREQCIQFVLDWE